MRGRRRMLHGLEPVRVEWERRVIGWVVICDPWMMRKAMPWPLGMASARQVDAVR